MFCLGEEDGNAGKQVIFSPLPTSAPVHEQLLDGDPGHIFTSDEWVLTSTKHHSRPEVTVAIKESGQAGHKNRKKKTPLLERPRFQQKLHVAVGNMEGNAHVKVIGSDDLEPEESVLKGKRLRETGV